MPVKTSLLLGLILAITACTPNIQPRGTAAQDPALDKKYFHAADGITLPLTKWLPDTSPQAVLVAVHGFNDYRNAFAYMAPYLRERGIAVYAYDQRGFGDTARRGIWPGTDVLTRDLHQITRLIGEEYPRVPIYWLGHSMGAAVVIMAAARRDNVPVEGLILVAPAVWGGESFNGFYRFTLWLGAHTFPWARVSNDGLDIEVSDNHEVLEALSQDPLMLHDSRIDTLYGLVNLMDRALENSGRLALPTLVQYGQKDEVIPKAPVCGMLAIMQNEPVSLFYEQGYHLLLRDKNAEVVWQDIAAWLSRRPIASVSSKQADCGSHDTAHITPDG